ncbi:MAG: FAD-dependent oxidoreductase [Cyclobacteriaceae bacterium]
MPKIIILGAGLSGISTSFHLGHKNCHILEKNSYPGGHIHSEKINGFTWDEGPHVSFTKSDYVKNLFAENVGRALLEYPVKTGNYFKGTWIPHPAQSNLWAVPQPLKDKCLSDFLESRDQKLPEPKNYEDWLRLAFGNSFYEHFSRAYTEKYWTVRPKDLSTDWVGERVFYPKIEDVEHGYLAPLIEQTHYIKKIRYPENGGYFSFAHKLYNQSNISFNKELNKISFKEKKLWFSDGSHYQYKKLVSTIPLPVLIDKSDAPEYVKTAAEQLNCSSVLLINVTANHTTARRENWIYVYDEDKYSTRINCTELLSPNNAPNGKTGVQVEVYFSQYRAKAESDEHIAAMVCQELIEMGLIESHDHIEACFTKWVQWANVIFDHDRRNSLKIIFDYLETQGMTRESDEMNPMTNWENKDKVKCGEISLAGRFAQWKYYWTDDCVLRGKVLSYD